MFYYICLVLCLHQTCAHFSHPLTTLYIAVNCQLFYLLASVLLIKTESQHAFYTSVIGYSYLLQYYAVQYPHVPLFRLKLAYTVRLLNLFNQKVNTLSFRFDNW